MNSAVFPLFSCFVCSTGATNSKTGVMSVLLWVFAIGQAVLGVRADKLRPWYAYPQINPWDMDAPARRHLHTMLTVRFCWHLRVKFAGARC